LLLVVYCLSAYRLNNHPSGGKMDQEKYFPNDRTREYFSKIKDKLTQSHNLMSSTNNSFSDKEKLITLSIDNFQIIHTINISEKLLVSYEKGEICDRLVRMINQAIIKSSINGVNEAKNAVSPKELTEIISNENRDIKENIELLNKNIEKSFAEYFEKTKTVFSKSGNIKLVISRNRIIQSLTISDEYIKTKNKLLIETELLETVNGVMGEIMDEIQRLIKKNNDEINEIKY
jgi:DNA-binding protein YbaB